MSYHRTKSIWVNAPTPPFSHHFEIVNESNGNKLNSLIYGYTRLLVEDSYTIAVPNEIKFVILLFYHVKKSMIREDAFGTTYQCQRKQSDEKYIVKILNKSIFYRIPYQYRPRYLRAMHDEIEIMKYTEHPDIIQLHNYYEDKTSIYIVMEKCTGGQLLERFAAKQPFSEHSAAKIIKQLLSALRYMHEENDIIHCDLKPQNILFADESDDSGVRIIQFGFSKVIPRIKHSHLCDTQYYTAPEVIKSKKCSHACDMWSIGVIVYIMLFGYPPFYVDPVKYGKDERKRLFSKIRRGFIARIRSTEKHGFGPWFPDHIHVSQEARHFISKLLEFKVRKRYTAAEALSHPWIKIDKNDEYDKQNMEKHSEAIQSLTKFNNVCQFKSDMTQLFRQQLHKMKPVHFHELEQLFIKMDIDNDGIISCKEFNDSLSNTQHFCIEKQLVNNECGIKYSDLLNALVNDYIVTCDQHLYSLLRAMDDDDDSKIEIRQLKEQIKAYDPFNEYDRAMELININQSVCDGISIDYEEFLLNLHPNFEGTLDWLPDILKNMKAFSNQPNETF